MALNAHDRQAVSIDDLKQVPPAFVNYLAVSFIVGVATMIGTCLLVVPGLVAAVLLFPALALVVDKGMDPISAVQRSVAMVKPHFMQVAIAMPVIGFMNFLGAIPLGLGLLVTGPVSLLALACIYRSLDH